MLFDICFSNKEISSHTFSNIFNEFTNIQGMVNVIKCIIDGAFLENT